MNTFLNTPAVGYRCLTKCAIAVCIAMLTPACFANDSSAAIGIGGLTLKRNDAVSMDYEELFISAQQIRVKYRFTNTTDKEVETLVSFPLPPMLGADEVYYGDRGPPTWDKDLNFETRVDGVPVKYQIHETVNLHSAPTASNQAIAQTDVRAQLSELHWPAEYWKADEDFIATLNQLPDAKKRAYVAEGLLKADKSTNYLRPNWSVTTHVTRMQVFPAGKTISVEHSYTPINGSSVAGGLLKRYRMEKGSGFPSVRKSFCIENAFLKSFDRTIATQNKIAKAKNESGDQFYEQYIRYVLRPGANWQGPIKEFRLIVDKESPNNLVSFCMDGVKKISPTQYEVRKTNFTPARDLQILIAAFPEQQQIP
jgi:Domain of unknown function (DUF4424)